MCVSDNVSVCIQGSQFVRGFGGIGALLRWKVDFVASEEPLEDDDFF